MSDYFIDHRSYTDLLGDTPSVFGVPQEGDGSGKYPATSASIATVTFTAVPTTGTFTICGMSPVSTGVLNAASTAAAATALAANININPVQVTTAAAIGTPVLKNLVYARAVDNICEIMMRVGSESLNYVNNPGVAISSTYNNAPTIVQFAGGTGGCLGWLVTDVALSGYSIGAYGVASTSNPLLLCSSATPTVQTWPGPTDILWLRSGTGRTIEFPISSTSLRLSSSAYDQHVRLDSNTKWTEDSGTGIFTVYIRPTGTTIGLNLSSSTTRGKSLSAVIKNSFKVLNKSGTNSMGVNNSNTGSGAYPTLVENIFIGEATNTEQYGWLFPNSGTYATSIFRNCTFQWDTPRTGFAGGGGLIGSCAGKMVFEDCNFIFNHNTAVKPLPLLNFSFVSSRNTHFRFTRCNFSNQSSSTWAGGKYTALLSPQANFTSTEFIAEECTGLELDNYLNMVDIPTVVNPNLASYYYRSAEPGNEMRIEKNGGYIEWRNSVSQPVLSALLPDQVTRWSMKMSWTNTPVDVISPAMPFSSPKLAQFFRGTSTERTLTLEILAKNSVDFNTDNCAVRVGYTGEDGVMRTLTTRSLPDSLVSSLAQWSNVPTNFVAKKFVITLPTAIMPFTEVTTILELYRTSPTGNPEEFYFDPQPLIS